MLKIVDLALSNLELLGGVEVAFATSPTVANELVTEMLVDAGEDGLIAVDLETAPLPEAVARLEAAANASTDKGFRSAVKRQLKEAGLHPHRAEVRVVQFYAGGRRVAVFDMRHIPWNVLDPIWSRPLVMHNAGFDLALLMRRGIVPDEVHCTLQAVRLLRGHGHAKLDEAAADYLGIAVDKALQKGDWSQEGITDAQRNYAALDVVATWRLAEKVLGSLGDRAEAYEIQMAAMMPAIRMQLRGVRPDLKAHDELIKGLRDSLPKYAGAYLAACREMGRPDLCEKGVPTTPRMVEALLDEILSDRDYENWERTRTGRLSTAKNNLAFVEADYPPIKALMSLKQIITQLKTYGESWALHVNPDTGRIHSTYNVAGALTGRASNQTPNIQQLPKRQPIAGLPSFRMLITAEHGHTLVGADYDQMEMRIAAAVSEDVAMTAALAKGQDLHKVTAAMLLSTEVEDVTDEQRGFGKTVNFAQLYGQGTTGLIRRLRLLFGMKLMRSEAEQWRARFRRTFPQFAAWSARQVRLCNVQRMIAISSGRVYEYAWGKPNAYHNNQAINLPIQGRGADISMIALARIDAALRKEKIQGGAVIWIHDEIVLEVGEADADRASRLLKEAMETAFLEILPDAPTLGLLSVKRGHSWGALK